MKEIIKLSQLLFQKAQEIGITNIFQPGLIKEIIIADALGHKVITAKHQPDATNQTSDEFYEYLSCIEGGSCQFDRMFARPQEKRQKSLARITRNSAIFCVVFYRSNQIKIKAIYKLDIQTALGEVERQLDKSTNAISHTAFNENWLKANAEIVCQNQ